MRMVALVHLLDWTPGAGADLTLTQDVRIGSLARSKWWGSYESLCTSKGVDQGEPYAFGTFVEISGSWWDVERLPFSTLSRVLNVLTLAIGQPVGMTRVIAIDDADTVLGDTTLAHMTPDWQAASFEDYHLAQMDAAATASVRAIWDGGESARARYPRLATATDYFCSAWQSSTEEHACISLAIVLEALFGPSATSEVAHQVAFNASRFNAVDTAERVATYRLIKKFYSARSRLVHGESTDGEALLAVLPAVFRLCAVSLRRILADDTWARRFCERREREALVEEWTFG